MTEVFPASRWYVPLRIAWGGFVANTLFYAAVIWLLFLFAPRTLRRLIRIHRGLCPACAYPVGESPVCTECGVKFKHHRAPTPQ